MYTYIHVYIRTYSHTHTHVHLSAPQRPTHKIWSSAFSSCLSATKHQDHTRKAPPVSKWWQPRSFRRCRCRRHCHHRYSRRWNCCLCCPFLWLCSCPCSPSSPYRWFLYFCLRQKSWGCAVVLPKKRRRKKALRLIMITLPKKTSSFFFWKLAHMHVEWSIHFDEPDLFWRCAQMHVKQLCNNFTTKVSTRKKKKKKTNQTSSLDFFVFTKKKKKQKEEEEEINNNKDRVTPFLPSTLR